MTTELNDVTESSLRKPRRASEIARVAPTKPAGMVKLLLRARGATPLELIAATDWQPHSVRAFLSGLRKQGRSIVREARKSGEFAYRIETANVELVTAPVPPVDQVEG